ncbi:hypothetical protein [Microseira wollei]|uniref:hypothetical protein n=1 Tax=Microseira wollei TaxID=467598 RepID=UPI001CFD160B|nr:hypothetical protein [Microseira wollei]
MIARFNLGGKGINTSLPSDLLTPFPLLDTDQNIMPQNTAKMAYRERLNRWAFAKRAVGIRNGSRRRAKDDCLSIPQSV